MDDCIGSFVIADHKILDIDTARKIKFPDAIVIYEVFRIINKIPLFLDDHICRFENSAKLSGFRLSVSPDQIKKEVLLLISRNSFSDANIKLIASFTQGEGNSESQFCGYFIEHQYPSVQEFADGVAVITYQAIRQNPNAKVINMSLRQTTNEMKSSIGVYEVLLVDNEGNITEGSRSNVFFIRRGQFFTPSVTDVLPGITRKYVMEAIRNLGLPISECKVSLKDAECMQTVFITGTSRKILPVNRMNLRNFRVDNPYLSAVMAEFNRIVTTTLESFR